MSTSIKEDQNNWINDAINSEGSISVKGGTIFQKIDWVFPWHSFNRQTSTDLCNRKMTTSTVGRRRRKGKTVTYSNATDREGEEIFQFAMGRGGGRGKASSTGTTFEAEAAFIPVDLNTTLIEFILSGHFESDYFSYCSNRLSDYTCRYWFSPSQPEDEKAINASVFTSSAHSTSPFSMLNDASTSTEIKGPVETHSEMLIRFANPANIPAFLTGKIGSQGWTKSANETTLLLTDLVPFNLYPNQQTCSIILCVVFLVSFILNLLSWHCLRRLSGSGGLCIARLLFYLTFLESIDLFIELNDALMHATHGVPMLTVIGFLGRWSCQTLAMGYTCLKHTEGLLITSLAIDSLISLKQLRHHIAGFRAEWAFNAFILIIATVATTSSQFFWTFDLFHVDNRIPPSESLFGGGTFAEPTLYICGFSASWGLSHAFVSFIWPTLDHLIGDVLPCILPLAAGIVILSSRRNTLETDGCDLNVDCPGDLDKFMWILPVLFLLHGLSILPRMLFYMLKYLLFSERYHNRVGLVFHREDDQRLGDGETVTAIAKVISFRQIYPSLLPHLQDVETALRFLLPIFALAKATSVIAGFSKSRRILSTGLNRILAFCNDPMCHGQSRVKSGQTTKITSSANHLESISFSALANSPISRVEPSRRPVYINLEDVEELAV
uniref:U3 small nucleolar RNA associated protein 22 n=1 Tax=Echinococcus granulosus TaxID=6210 RepID=A0A068WWN3_ECHGR|nr:U3 small nucleolar RNA associated protein 22 [Echinococcus granulosus]